MLALHDQGCGVGSFVAAAAFLICANVRSLPLVLARAPLIAMAPLMRGARRMEPWVAAGPFLVTLETISTACFVFLPCLLMSRLVQPLARGLCGFSTGKFVPQELKPRFQAGSNGTTEVVPFPESIYETRLRAGRRRACRYVGLVAENLRPPASRNARPTRSS